MLFEFNPDPMVILISSLSSSKKWSTQGRIDLSIKRIIPAALDHSNQSASSLKSPSGVLLAAISDIIEAKLVA